MILQGSLRATRPAAAVFGLLVGAWCMFAGDAAAQTLPTLSIDSPTVNEGDSGSTSMAFTVRLSASSASEVTVNYADAGTGTATSGTDYDAVTAGTLTFSPGTRSQAITVTVQGDITVEADETVVIELSSPSSGATLSTTASSGTGTISNDDTLPTLSIDSPTVNEGDSGSTSMVFTVRLSAAYSQAVTVGYADAGTGTATSGTDYTAVTAGTLTFAAGTTSQTITVSVTGDTTSEPDETVAISLSNPTNATVSTATATGTIADNDTLSISSPSVDEGDSGSTDLVFTVSLNGSKTSAVTVNYADAGTGTATSGTDYDAVTAGTLTIAAGTTSQTITVSVTGDITVEPDETVVIELSNPSSGATLSATASSGTGTISNDDTLPVLSIDSPSVNEGDTGSTDLTFTVTLSAAYSQDVTVTYADALTGTATSGTDYTAVSATVLTITAGTTSQTFNVSVQGDTTAELDETVVITLGNPTNATVSTAPRTGTGTGTITDDDTLSISSPFVDEGDSGSANLVFTVSLGGTKAAAVTVNYADAGTGTATSGTDYTAVTAGTLTIAAGATSGTITVLVTGDTTVEPDETVVIALTNASGAGLLPTTSTGTGTIRDDDTSGTPTFSINSPTVTEGDSGSTNMTFTVSLNPAANRSTRVIFGITGGTATSGTDYTTSLQNNRVTLRFNAGETSKTVSVAVQGDTLDEADETVVAQLSGAFPPFAARIGAGMGTGTGTITDDDTSMVSIDSPTVVEGDTGSRNMTFTVSLSTANSRQVRIAYTDVGAQQTATSGTDYTALPDGTLTFAPGETSKTVTVEVLGDRIDEPDETVRVQLGLPANANAMLGTNWRGDGTITDDDLAWLRTAPVSVAEGDSGSTNLNFTITLSDPAGEQITVAYADTGRGTATSGTDYTALAAGTMTIAQGATTGTIAVEVLGDGVTERDETIELALSNPTNARFVVQSMATWTGTIRDDDGFPVANAGADQEVSEGATVTLTGSGSDPDGDTITEYRWTQTAGPAVTLSSATGTTTSFTAPTGLVADEVLRFSFVVTAGGEGGSDSVDVTVNAATVSWTVDAGPNQTVEEDLPVTLAGRTMSGGADLVLQGVRQPAYSWRHTAGAATVNMRGANTATPTFTAPNLLANTDLTFTMTVTIGDETMTDTMVLTVEADNDDPVANAGRDLTVWEGSTVTLPGSGWDPEGESLTYAWTQTGGIPNVTLTGASSPRPRFVAPRTTVDLTLTFELTVTAGGASHTDTVDVTVQELVLLANAGPDQVVGEDETVRLDGSLSTVPFGESITYSWSQTGGPSVTLTGATTARPTFISPLGQPRDVTLTFTLTVSAVGDDSTATDTVDVIVEAVGPAFTPGELRADAGRDQTVDGGDTVRLDGRDSTGPDYLTYSWRQTRGPLVELEGATTARPSFTAPDVDDDTTLTFELTVAADGDTDTDTVAVTVATDVLPILLAANAGADQTVDEGDAVRLDGSGSTATGEALRYSWRQTGGRPTVTLTGATTAAPRFTAPDVDEDTTLTFTLTVTAGGESDTDTVRVAILDTRVLSVDSPNVVEGDSGTTDLTFTVSLSAASERRVTVSYATADGTASAGADYQATSGRLRFAAGQTEKTVSVSVLGDLRPEGNETFTLTLSNPVNAEVARSGATGTIVNDDTAMMSVEDVQMEEGDDGTTDFDFTVSLSPASELEVAVSYATADGTASSRTDYRAASGELRFAPGETEKTVSVSVLGDLRPEVDETFTLTLSSPANAEIARAEATGTIVNDDTAQASIADARMEEGDSGATDLDFTVTLSVAGDLEVTVSYATADGTASAGADYQATSGRLRFGPGETEQTVSVPVLGDLRPEVDETFTVTLSDPVNAETDRAEATGTIVNDDTAQASIADMRAEEGDSGVTDAGFTVTLSVAGDLAVSVSYATADGTASAGTDYQTASGELQFAPGETEMTVSVPVLGDTLPEADETFTVTLSSPSNAELATTAATGTIVDDDVADARTRALEASMASFGRTFTWDAIDAISGRFDGTSAARGSQMVLGGSPVGQRETAFADPFASWNRDFGFGQPAQIAQMHSRQPWRNRLSLGDFLQQSSFHLALSEGDGDEGRDLSIWGRASSGRFSGQPSTGLSSDGQVVTGYLGVDGKVGNLFAGVALAHSTGDVDYGISDFGGNLDMSLTSVLPYANFQLNEKLEVWSMVGIGWGEADFQDAVRTGRTEAHATRGTLDLSMRMAAIGANRALATWQNIDLELKSDAFVMSMDGEANGGGAQPEVSARAQGIRLALAGRKELVATEQGRLGANLEFGGRWDGGDAQTGTGAEVGGGLDYRHADLGLGVALQGQYLLFHQADSFDERGVSLTLEFDPGVQGQGFSLALRPAWGAYPGGGAGGAGALWNNDALLRVGGMSQNAGPGMASERLDLEWGYGFGPRRGSGLRLQGVMSQHGASQRRYRFGGALEGPGKTRGSLELSRQEWLGEASHGFLITWEHMR